MGGSAADRKIAPVPEFLSGPRPPSALLAGTGHDVLGLQGRP